MFKTRKGLEMIRDNFFQSDRYYIFERVAFGKDYYCVGYFRRGTNFQLTETFEKLEDRNEFIKTCLSGFNNVTGFQ